MPNKENWDAFYAACVDDEPKWPMIAMAQSLSALCYNVVIVSGRSDAVAVQTQEWLARHNVPYTRLFLRPNNDHTPDYKLKRRWFETSGYRPEDISYVFEDRTAVVQMWRELGITTLQVCDGDY